MTEEQLAWISSESVRIATECACCRECQTDALVASIASALTTAIRKASEEKWRPIEEASEHRWLLVARPMLTGVPIVAMKDQFGHWHEWPGGKRRLDGVDQPTAWQPLMEHTNSARIK